MVDNINCFFVIIGIGSSYDYIDILSGSIAKYV